MMNNNINAKELRVGNLICCAKQIKECDIDDIFYISKSYNVYEPIRLTSSWFLRFGLNTNDGIIFEKVRDSNFFVKLLEPDSHFIVFWKSSRLIKPIFVHQFQNLYFALTGNELTLL